MSQIKTKPLLLQANWNAPRNIQTRISTCSQDFNLALHVQDDPERVKFNREKLRALLPADPLWLNQTHSTTIIDWDAESEYQIHNADAAISCQKKSVCVVMTADCLPTLLTNTRGEFVAAIHAGWRGLNDGIIQQTLSKLAIFNPNEMLAFIGPAINQECFEIGTEVRESFINQDPTTIDFFIHSKNSGKFMADLRGIAAHKLIQAGLKITNISNSKICTRCHTEWFYSYRANPKTGRIASLIWIE